MPQHWDRTYTEKSVEQFGWYEPDPGPSLALIDRCELSEDARIIDVGAGATLLVDQLLDRGYEALGVLDISAQALSVLRDQLAPERAGRVRWINADITDPAVAEQIGPVDLWHDRALLHFLIDDGECERYVEALRATVVPGRHAVIAAFAVGGAEMCNGLARAQLRSRLLPAARRRRLRARGVAGLHLPPAVGRPAPLPLRALPSPGLTPRRVSAEGPAEPAGPSRRRPEREAR